MDHVQFDNIWNTYGILLMMNYLQLEFIGNALVHVIIICKLSFYIKYRVPKIRSRAVSFKIDFGHPEIGHTYDFHVNYNSATFYKVQRWLMLKMEIPSTQPDENLV